MFCCQHESILVTSKALTEPSRPSQASPIPATARPSRATASHSTSPTALHRSAPSSKHLIASEYIPAKRYISPKSFNSLPPAKPLSGAEVYFVPVLGTCGAALEFAVAASETEDEDRVKGLLSAVDRRNGFDVGAIALVWMGGKDGGPTDVGRPPGVRARVRDMPKPLCVASVSADCECGSDTGVTERDRGCSSVGVADVAWPGKRVSR